MLSGKNHPVANKSENFHTDRYTNVVYVGEFSLHLTVVRSVSVVKTSRVSVNEK